MSAAFLLEQLLNGVQLGVMLFLMAAGLTLVFGVMGLINLAHGSLYMVGAFACAWTVGADRLVPGSALGAGLRGGGARRRRIEIVVIRRLYDRDHLDQVLATFSLILFFNEVDALAVRRAAALPEHPRRAVGRACRCRAAAATRSIASRIIAVGLLVALGLYLLIPRTRLGMLIRAGERIARWSQRSASTSAPSTRWCSGSAPCWRAWRARWSGRCSRSRSAWASRVLILAFVVVVIGGIGSIRAPSRRLLVGVVDTLGRACCRAPSRLFMSHAEADGAGAGARFDRDLSRHGRWCSLVRPKGLFPRRMPETATRRAAINRAGRAARCVAGAAVRRRRSDEPFYVTLATRVRSSRSPAVGLNLVLGYGGLVSFGHAAFFGLGGYAVGILATTPSTAAVLPGRSSPAAISCWCSGPPR